MNTTTESHGPSTADRVQAKTRRVVVVGAGIGGLAVAGRLAAQGFTVTVVESSDRVGGKLGIFERDGFRFDTGPSIVTLPSVYRDLWSAMGADFDADLTLRRLDPIARYRFGDGSWLEACADDTEFSRNLDRLRPGNADEMRAFLDRAERIWDATRSPFLERPLNGMLSLIPLACRFRDLRTIAPGKTMRALAKQYLHDERLVNFVDRYATYTGSDPRQAPAALASIPFVERHFGGWYIEGGLFRLGEALAERCVTLGVTIRCLTTVKSIQTAPMKRRGLGTKERCCGVLLASGEQIEADIVIANADAHHLYADLLAEAGPVRAKALRSLRAVQPSLSGFVICCAVEGITPDLAHHTVLFPEDYDQEFDDLFGINLRPVRNPTIYASVPGDPSIAASGCEAWFILVNAPRHSPDDLGKGIDWDSPGLAENYADQVLEQMANRGLDIRTRIRFRELRSPAELQRRTGAVGGSIYGTSSNGMRAAFLRPQNRSKISGLFLVGGSSHPGGGLPLVTLSAQIVAKLVAES